MAEIDALHLFDVGPDTVLVGAPAAGEHDKHLAGRRQFHSRRHPVEELNAHALLDEDDLAIDGGGGDPQSARGGLDRTVLGDRLHVEQSPGNEMEAHPSLFSILIFRMRRCR